MTFLPIVERELRVRARRGATYWSRSGLALASLLVCLPQLLVGGGFGAAATARNVFNSLIVGMFLLCTAACFLTADTISAERREGTLGLLFLTRVRSFDVLWGKLGSAGLTCVCVLMGFVPVLMIPVMAGGVTGGEAVRKALALLSTLFVSLVTGLLSSARQTQRGRAFALATFWLSVILFLPFLFESLALQSAMRPTLGLLSPLTTVICAGDSNYRSMPGHFWISLALVNALAWLLGLRAVTELRRRVREETSVEAAAVSAQFRPVDVAMRRRWMSSEAAAGPVDWLVHRQPGIKGAIWAAMLLGAFYSFLSLWYYRLIPFAGPRLSWYAMIQLPGFVVTLLDGALLAWAASRFFVEARRSGEFELLLTTPLGANTIVSGQWNALKGLLRWPALVLLSSIILRMVLPLALGTPYRATWQMYNRYNILGMVLSLAGAVAGIGAMCWLGLWFGLKSRGQAAAIAWTVGLGKGVPFLTNILGFGVLSAILFSIFRGSPTFSYAFSWLPQIGVLVFYLWMIRMAKRRLGASLLGFTELNPGSHEPPNEGNDEETPNTKLQTPGKFQTPNTKLQTPSKLQTPDSKHLATHQAHGVRCPPFRVSVTTDPLADTLKGGHRTGRAMRDLELGVWRFPGVWCLEFGVFLFPGVWCLVFGVFPFL